MMVFKKIKDLFIKISLLSALLFTVCGCFELGDYESDDEYFKFFPNVLLIDTYKNDRTYSVKDYFYTEEGVNDFKSDVATKEYLYLAVQIKEDALLDEMNLSFCSTTDCTLTVSVFIVDQLPQKIRGYNDPEKDEEDNVIEYDDPTEPISTKFIHLTADEWDSAYLINQSRNDLLEVKKDQYFLLRFENNSWTGKEESRPLVSFTTTNLLIRVERS